MSAMKKLTVRQNYTEKFSHCDTGNENGSVLPKTKVLIVDDRPENLIALAAVLDSADYEVVTANSGQEALRYVLREEFALILLDVQMPGLDGFETARLIKARQKTSHIPIVFITAASQATEHVQKGFEVGAIDYVFKPFSPDRLRRKVDAFIKMAVSHQEVRRLVDARTAQLKASNHKLREEAVKRRRIAESFRTLFQASPCLMAISSLVDGRLLEVNKSWLYNTGYDYNEVIGRHHDIIDIRYYDNNEKVFPTITTLRESRKSTRIIYFAKNGEKREGLLATELVELDHQNCMLLVITDISQQARLEREVIKLDRFHLIGEMAAALAHEIRNPMTSIRGFLQLAKVKERCQPVHIDIMIEEIDRANSIITEFLTLAKDKRVEREPKSINEIIQAIYPLIQAEAVMAGKTVKLVLGECPVLKLDEKEIRQLILNLAFNGLEAMSQGGRLEISTTMENKNVVLAIKDEGPGVEDTILDKIMMPFFTTKDSGTGLGLPICYSVAARHEASIDISTSKAGTIFFVRFPLLEH